MTAQSRSDDIITLAPFNFEADNADAYRGWQAAAPLLFGFVAPLALAISFNHQWLRDEPILLFLLLAALALSTLLFAASLISGGEVKAAVFDPGRQRVALVRHNPFATSTWHLAFEKIAEIRSFIHYDHHGRKTLMPEIVLVSGARVSLPAEINRLNLEAARSTIERYQASALPAPKRARDPRRASRRAD